MSGDGRADRIRIDKWLWHARFFKTRALAQAAAASGVVRLNGARVVKSAHGIKQGDVLTIPAGRETLAVRVLAFGLRRGPPPEARVLYEIVAGPGLDQETASP